ncbi:MAG: PTS sugar transporter subunit IIA [Planctomycetota bacterium]|jgi:mannitol/fructose-specific phosphotransferase system IIA component (Ntr-type)
MTLHTEVEDRSLSSLLCSDAFCMDLQGTTTETVLEELVSGLGKAGAFPETAQASVLDKVLEREQLGTTGIGHGIAIPHGKHLDVNSVIGTIGVSQAGVDFCSLDGKPVHVVLMIVAPPDARAAHLQALQAASNVLRNPLTAKHILQASSIDEIMETVVEAEQA